MLEKFKQWYFGKIDKRVIAAESLDLLQNEAFVIAKEAVQNDILEEWGSTQITDSEKREKLFLKYRALEELCDELSGLAANLDQSQNAKSDQGGQNDG